MTIFYVDASNANTHADNSGCTEGVPITGSAATLSGFVLTLDGSPDLSALIGTPGDTQSAIWLSQATNANRKIFKIVSFDDTANTVNLDPADSAPTGITSSAWRIGGTIAWPSGTTVYHSEAMLRPGDILQFNNSPASRTAAFFTHRSSGTTSAAGGGPIIVRGKAGVRPVFTISSGAANTFTGMASINLIVENLDLVQSGTGSVFSSFTGSFNIFDRLKISAAGAAAVVNPSGTMLSRCEIFSGTADGISAGSAVTMYLFGCYIHDCGDDGTSSSIADPQWVLWNNIIDSCAGRGLTFTATTSGATRVIYFLSNTIYGCGNSGLEIADTDTRIHMHNNIFSQNGNAAGEYNVEFTEGGAASIERGSGWHLNNLFYHSGGGGGANLLGLTVNTTELITDPLFTNPASGDFTLQSGSPAKGTGFPGAFLNGPTSYMDMGAVQRQESGGSGGGSMSRVFSGM